MIIKFQPFPADPWSGELARVERGINGLFGEFLGEPAGWQALPRVDVVDRGDEFIVLAELPGLKKEDLKIVVHEGVLKISGERKAPAKVEGSRWVRNEIGTGRFQRSIELPSEVKSGSISASLTNGILRVTLPKAEEARPREISIQ